MDVDLKQAAWRGRGLVVAVACLLVAVAFGLQAASAQAPKKEEGFQTSAPAALLLDPESNSVLYEKNADEPVAPASLAKLMTLEFLFNELKKGTIKLDDTFVITEDAWRKGGAPSHGSTMFAALHSQVKVADLIQGIIVDSANDACIAIADGVAGNETTFGQMLTKRAREIGLENSNFTNAEGYPDPKLRVTVRDLAKLARYIMQNYPDYFPYFALRDFTWNKIHQENRNPLLAMGIGADGMKTGETAEAGFNLVGSATQDKLKLIVVVTGAKSGKERAEEGKKLLDFGFNGFESKVLFAEGQTIGYAKVFGGDKGYVPLVGSGTITMRLPRNSNERLLAKIVYTGPVPAPVSEGQPIGVLKVWRGDDLALEVPLTASEDIGKGNMRQRAVDGATELMIGLFKAGVGKL